MKKLVLNNGVDMPVLGLGVYQIEDAEQCAQCVANALAAGYRLIDTAAAYRNEDAVGQGIRRSGVARGDLFVTTKLWIQDAGYESAKRAFDRSLARLRLDYLDLYLIHQPIGDVHGAWRALQELYQAGRVRAIGVSNFQPDRLADLIAHHDIAPAINQLETHPFCQQKESEQFLRENGVQMQSWGPFAEGRNKLFANEVLLALAAKHGRSVAQIVLRWLIERDVVAIPKSVRKERIIENIQVFDFELSPHDMNLIAGLDKGESSFFSHRDPAMIKLLAAARYDI